MALKSYEQNFPAIIESLDLAIKLAQRKKVSGIVTLPILKKTLTINELIILVILNT